MKVIAVIGLVGTLCVFAIMAWMFGEQAESLTPHINNLKGKTKTANEDRLVPLPHGQRMMMADLKFALIAYTTRYGDIPRASKTGLTNPSSNDILRQFFKGAAPAEKNFALAGSPVATKKTDGNTTGNNALAPGENHWAYIEPPKHISSYSSVPLLIEPYRPGETSYRQEDYGPGRNVLVVFSDGAIRDVPINSKGQPVIKSKNLFSSDYPGWRGDTPKVYQPAP